MHARAQPVTHNPAPEGDQVVHLYGATWADYERLLAIRGEKATPRISYLKGTLEIMTPSRDHETLKSYIGCLVEAYCLERGIRFVPVGAWTLKDESEERGAEPDECYLFGDADPAAQRPHLAIEVEWTSKRIDKLQIYRRLGVGEVWYWRRGRIEVYGLEGDQYRPLERSLALPDIDLDLLVQFLDRPTAYDAIRDYRAALSR
jgi:Uma2 family endonuclease